MRGISQLSFFSSFELTCRPRFLRYRFDSPDTSATALRDHGDIKSTPSPHSPSSSIDLTLTHVRTFHVYVATKNTGALGE